MREAYFFTVAMIMFSSWVSFGATQLAAQDPAAPPTENAAAEADDQQQRFSSFSQAMQDVVMVGHFTVTGAEKRPLAEEHYEIRRVTKMGNGDYWLFHARIKYGEHDVTLPLPLEVKWAGRTPVITLDNVTIPALGTFDARVVIDGDRYAGTWTHGKVGGHLFGTIRRRDEEPSQ